MMCERPHAKQSKKYTKKRALALILGGIFMKLHALLKSLHDFRELPEKNPQITSIEVNSKQVQQGSLFICIKGHNVDGHKFAKEAINHGALAIVSEQLLDVDVPVILVRSSVRALSLLVNAFYDQPTSKMTLIGVTGTNGKTSVTYLIDSILKKSGQNVGLIGTIGMTIGNEFFPTKNTTPDALVLQKMFHTMVERKVETAVMEVSSHALHIGRIQGCQYDVTVFTNLSQDHLDYHKTMDAYKAAKSLLFSQLGNVYDINRPKFAVLNVDDEATNHYITSTQGIVLTYGIDHSADLKASNIGMSSKGTTFDLTFHHQTYQVQMGLIGKFNVYNVLAAIGACLASGLPLNEILDHISCLEGVPGRFDLVDLGQDFTVIVDYAHTPDGLENVLKTAKEFATGNIYCVVGCGGDRDQTKRPIMAKIATELSDFTTFTSDNPRTEQPQQILNDMEVGVVNKRYSIIVDRKDAITHSINQAKTGDIVLIAGKGHEDYQIIGETIVFFDDRLVAADVIKERLQSE